MTIDLKEDINYIHIDSQKAERYISIRFYSISESEHIDICMPCPLH